MIPIVTVAAACSLLPFYELPTEFWGVTPECKATELDKIQRKHEHAVVLVHGLWIRPLESEKTTRPDPHEWQVPSAPLVKALADEADVFAVSYAQTVPLDGVLLSKGLRDGIAAVKKAGYTKITLIGHSAGGVISRRFVELNPDAGVTKVITVASPHTGSGLAKVPGFIQPKAQQPFIRSMLPEFREQCEKECHRDLPKDVEMCCVICKVPRLGGDASVSLSSQWPECLQTQGVPAVIVAANHFEAMTAEKAVKAIAEVAKGKVVRWTSEQTDDARKALFGEKKK